MRPSRLLAAVALALPASAAAVNDALAQCAMCAQSAAAAGPPAVVGKTLGFAALALLVPVTAAMGGTGYLLWRFRGGSGAQSSKPPSSP
jgi:hypothetical protein